MVEAGIPAELKRDPAAAAGLYNTGVKAGLSAFDRPTSFCTLPYPAVPVIPPLIISTVPSGSSVASGITRTEPKCASLN